MIQTDHSLFRLFVPWSARCSVDICRDKRAGMRTNLPITFIYLLLLVLMVYTGVSKLIGYERFRIVLEQFPIVGSLAQPLGWLLPLTELGVAILLAIEATRLAGLWASLLLLLGFTAFLLLMIAFYPRLPCNCGGVLEWLSWPQHLVFNLVFVGLNAAAILMAVRVSKKDRVKD